jgi:hypothetical protein
MQGPTKERWMQLAEQVTIEQDPRRLLKLITELNDLLREKEKKLGIIPPEKLTPGK